MINRVSIYFSKGGRSATRKVKRHRNSDTKNKQQRTKTKLPPWNGQ